MTEEITKPIGRERTCESRCQKTLLAYCDTCDKLTSNRIHDWNNENRSNKCEYPKYQCRECRTFRGE